MTSTEPDNPAEGDFTLYAEGGAPLELPRETAEAARPRQAVETDALSIDEAARQYGVSTSTLYRKLQGGSLAGAYKVGTPRGSEWRIPTDALEASGYRRKAEPIAPPPTTPEVSELVQALRVVTDALTAERRLLNAAAEDRDRAQHEREQARVDVARLEAELNAAREKSTGLEYELALARRRWWQRKPQKPELPPGESASS